MDQLYYNVNELMEGLRFEYLSTGQKIIRKAIVFHETRIPFLYSLTLGDIDADGKLSTESRSNNGDMAKNLATVYRTVEQFLINNPRALIIFSGNTTSKTRLYQIAIAKYLDHFLDRYLIWGIRCDNDQRETFQLNQAYQGFFITNKVLSS
ncbi:DUF6934 family protein [Dyadobacter sp. 22481]|uniref:DUF6934 family protein n=1 Tax=Dyadobacter sp. 22481 TaxID=3453926 RepID=UPI003F87ED2E